MFDFITENTYEIPRIPPTPISKADLIGGEEKDSKIRLWNGKLPQRNSAMMEMFPSCTVQ